MNEDIYFKWFQPLLLGFANTSEGRDILCIRHDIPEIVELSKKHIQYPTGNFREHVTEVHVGAKWGNIIRHRFAEFSKALDHYNAAELMRNRKWFELNGRLYPVPAGGTTTTKYPDPNPESSTVDGIVQGGDGTATWSSWRGASTGDSASDTSTSLNMNLSQRGTASDRWEDNTRMFALFDTSSIGTDQTVSEAKIAFATSQTAVTLASGDSASNTWYLVATTPASNTGLSTADFDQVGSTNFGSRAIAGLTVDGSTYNDWDLNASGIEAISLDGITKLGARHRKDYDDSEPSADGGGYTSSQLVAKSADNTGTSIDIKLVAVHADTPAASRGAHGII
jgi:hypothetical protein